MNVILQCWMQRPPRARIFDRSVFTKPMGAECPTANVQPTIEDGATPSASSHCATDARERTLARDRARRRERLAAETAEEKERRLAQRRVRDRARRASRSSPVSETRLEQWRSAEQRRRAVESSRQREARLARYRLHIALFLDLPETCSCMLWDRCTCGTVRSKKAWSETSRGVDVHHS